MKIETKFEIGDKVIYKNRICEIKFIKIKYFQSINKKLRLTYRIYDYTDGFGYDALESELTKFEDNGNQNKV